MAERLSPLDVSFLYVETRTTPMHVGSVAMFQPPDGGFDYDRLVDLISRRIQLVPRYRQKVRWVPGHIANPVWVDDPQFDITYHVRRSALPKPGSVDQLKELVGRVQSRRLDRNRPLWELYLVEGLAGGQLAFISKTHHAMVDGIAAVDIGTVLLDPTPKPRQMPPDEWHPRPEPSTFDLVAGAVADLVQRPGAAVDALRAGVSDVRAMAGKAVEAGAGVLAAIRTAARPAPDSPLNTQIGEQRRFGMLRTELDDYKRVRKAHGGTVNDVVLAAVAGALRSWLLTRGESVTTQTVIRAMVPVSVRGSGDTDRLGNQVSAYFIDLPVGEPNPVVRLHQVSYAMQAHKDTGQSVGAEALITLSGFAPPTIHSRAARLASGLTRRLFNVVVTNVPGPQLALYAGGALMTDAYPVVPLAQGQAVSIGLTSYNGGVFYGLNCDRDAMPDVDVLATCIEESLAELVETVQ